MDVPSLKVASAFADDLVLDVDAAADELPVSSTAAGF